MFIKTGITIFIVLAHYFITKCSRVELFKILGNISKESIKKAKDQKGLWLKIPREESSSKN